MHHDAVIHIVDIIALAAIEDFDVLVGARHLGLGGSLHGIGEGLGNAVVSDGDGLVAPGGGLLHHGGGVRQSVHIAHGGVQVQLHPLLPGSQILPLGHAPRHHGIGLEHHVIFKPILNQLALNPKHRAHLDIFQNGLCLPGFQEPADPDGAGVVGHVEFHHIGVALGQLLVVDGEHLALQDDGAHIHGHILHGNGISTEGLAIEGGALLGGGLGSGGLFPGLGHGVGLDDGLAHRVHGIKQGLAFQIAASLHMDFHRNGEALPEVLLHLGNQLFDGGLAVGPEHDGELLPFPGPFCPGQGAPGHGVAADEEHHQLLRLDFLKLGSRVGHHDLHPGQAIERQNVPLHGFQKPPGDVVGAVGRHMDAAAFRMDVGSNNGRLRKGLGDPLRRLIVRKHIQQINGLFHITVFRFVPAGRAAARHKGAWLPARPFQKSCPSRRRQRCRCRLLWLPRGR